MTSPLPWPLPIADRQRDSPPAGRSAEWLKLARLARLLSWLTLAWMGIEGGVAIGAAIVSGSVALLGFGLDSGIEAMASVIVIWRLTGTRLASSTSERRAQQLVAVSFYLLAPYIALEAIRALVGGDRAETSIVGLVLTAGTAILEPGLGVAKRRIGPGWDRQRRRARERRTCCALTWRRGVRGTRCEHAVRRVVAGWRGRPRCRRMGGHRGTAGLGRKVVCLPVPVRRSANRKVRSLGAAANGSLAPGSDRLAGADRDVRHRQAVLDGPLTVV